MQLNDDVAYQVLAIVEEIPKGRVASYGQIARLAGYDKQARLVGKILCNSQYYGSFPCHRVVNAQGRCAPGWDEQQDLLAQEGVQCKENGCVDMKVYQWKQ